MSETLPRGWVVANLPDVIYFQEGPGLRSWQFGIAGMPFLNIQTLSRERIDRSKCRFIKQKEFINKYEHFLLNEGDIVVSSSGTLGKIAVVKKEDLPIMLNTSIIRFCTNNSMLLSQLFLKHFLNSNLFYSQIISHKTGSAILNYGPTHLKKMTITLPPLNEQKRIVAKLDKIMPRIDSVKERLDKVSDLETQILLAFLYSSGKQHTIKKIEKYCCECTERCGKTQVHLRKIGVNKDKGITDLRSSAKDYSKYKIVKPGDFIYNPMRVNIGSIAIYNGQERCITSPDYVVFHTIKGLSAALLLKYLKSNQGLLEINHNTQGSVRSRLYYENLIKIKMPIAPIAEQVKAEKILNVFSKINSRKNNLLVTLDNLSKSVLAKAFRGELVPQDPNDEPAEKLLERILAEKAKMVTTLNKTKKKPKTARKNS
jgi:type I restriction enzyme, S subunit